MLQTGAQKPAGWQKCPACAISAPESLLRLESRKCHSACLGHRQCELQDQHRPARCAMIPLRAGAAARAASLARARAALSGSV
jgi:hypothetical protein